MGFFCDSPFVMHVLPRFETKKVQVSGDTAKKQVPASLPAKINIDTKTAGQADINVTIKVRFTVLLAFEGSIKVLK